MANIGIAKSSTHVASSIQLQVVSLLNPQEEDTEEHHTSLFQSAIQLIKVSSQT